MPPKSILTIVAMTIIVAVSATAAEEVRTYLKTGPAGVTIEQEYLPGSPETLDNQQSAAPTLRGDEVLWHKFESQPIFTTAELSMFTDTIAAGTYLNEPKEVECFDIEGDGTPVWTHHGNQFYVSSSKSGDVIAAVDYDPATWTTTVYKWNPDSEIPDWSYTINPCSCTQNRSIAVSPDGSTIAVLVGMFTDPGHSSLYCFSADSSTPLFVYDGYDNSFPRTLDITERGEYVAIYSAAMIHVVDVATGTAREVINAGASCDALAISGDGRYLAYGWPSFKFHEWDGSSYVQLWTRSWSGFYPSRCDLSSDGSTLVLAYNRSDCLQNRIELFDVPGSEPTWVYMGTPAAGDFQEYPADISTTFDGGYVAVGCWGDARNTNDEVLVFEHDSAVPYYTLDTPGSMFDIDIAAGDGALYLAACGKHIHANDNGRGGDLYSIKIETAVLGDFDGDGDVDLSDLAQLLANYGTTQGAEYGDGDMDGDGDVDLSDLAALLANYTG